MRPCRLWGALAARVVGRAGLARPLALVPQLPPEVLQVQRREGREGGARENLGQLFRRSRTILPN